MTKQLVRARPYFSEQDIQDALELIEKIIRSGHLIMGPYVEEFEQSFAKAISVRHAISVNSGTAALEIGLQCLGIEGCEVIVPTETFVATINAVLRAGGRPVFAEINPDTLCLDVNDVAQRITLNTAGVMTVHMAGLIAPDTNQLIQLCNQNGLFYAEDAAHAHGATIDGRYAGSLGAFGAFSFYPTKVMTTGEGGILTTNDDELAAKALSFRNHGAKLGTPEYERISTNWRLPEMSAALGITQLSHLDEFVDKRNSIAERYNDELGNVSGIKLLPTYDTIRHSYWNYILLLDTAIDRTSLAQELSEKYGVPVAWPYDPPCHLQPVFMETLGTGPGDLPISEEVLSHHLALPMHVALEDEDVAYIIESVKTTVQKKG